MLCNVRTPRRKYKKNLLGIASKLGTTLKGKQILSFKNSHCDERRNVRYLILLQIFFLMHALMHMRNERAYA